MPSFITILDHSCWSVVEHIWVDPDHAGELKK